MKNFEKMRYAYVVLTLDPMHSPAMTEPSKQASFNSCAGQCEVSAGSVLVLVDTWRGEKV